MEPLKDVFASHPRRWRDFLYVYPVISRRAHGLSIGINLTPDAICNFNCVYCCADRTVPRARVAVDLGVLESELRHLVAHHQQLFAEPEFRHVPAEFRRLNDVAFSGDGEPTIVPCFADAVRVAATVRRDYGLTDLKLVLITNACCLTRPAIAAGLAVLDENNGEIWAKLDAGSEEHFQRVSRAKVSLQHVLDNILATARVRPIVIQSLFLRWQGQPPAEAEIAAYAARLRWLADHGARVALVQVYTVARRTAEALATRLTAAELERIAAAVRVLGMPVAVFP